MSASLTPMTWSDYVRHTIGTDQQVDAARRTRVDQTTISRWVRGGQAGRAENVVKFARAYQRPVLEALVVAGFISESEARAQVTITKRENPSDEQLLELIAARLRRDQGDPHAHDTATNTRAGGSPAPAQLERIARLENELLQHRAREAAADAKAESSRYALAARHGTPDHAPDTTTGEHSQDDGGFDPA